MEFYNKELRKKDKEIKTLKILLVMLLIYSIIIGILFVIHLNQAY